MKLPMSAVRTETGVVISCAVAPRPFALELVCDDLKPLSRELPIWRVDGREVRLEIGPYREGIGQKDAELARPRLDLETQGWAPVAGSEQAGRTPTAEATWAVELDPPADVAGGRRSAYLRRRGDYFIALIASNENGDAPIFVERTLASLRDAVEREPESDTRTRDVLGASLWEAMQPLIALTGRSFRALISRDHASPRDRRLAYGVEVEAESLLALAELISRDPQLAVTHVSDGQSGHSLNSVSFDGDVVTYWDPWGEGSFLQADNNAAGVDARPHPTEKRLWQISRADFARVLYAIVLEEAALSNLLREMGRVFPALAPGALHDGRLNEAVNDEFFQFFHLREVEREGREQRTLVTFKPTAPTFRPHVTLTVEVEADRVGNSTLALSGAFVGDPANALFAIDIAKSYLKAVAPGQEALETAKLVHELRNLPRLRERDLELPLASHIRLPHVLSEGIMAYVGMIGGASWTEAGWRFSVVSEGGSGTDRTVVLSASAAESEPQTSEPRPAPAG